MLISIHIFHFLYSKLGAAGIGLAAYWLKILVDNYFDLCIGDHYVRSRLDMAHSFENLSILKDKLTLYWNKLIILNTWYK